MFGDFFKEISDSKERKKAGIQLGARFTIN
jgi:hypothetical protein